MDAFIHDLIKLVFLVYPRDVNVIIFMSCSSQFSPELYQNQRDHTSNITPVS